ncbi:unnamed protein product [Symbiodinium pilosum]|uniref:CobW C-terminal domain-containing protein n=1 Tax=Symbiodinium pilosum TaxID=2952 RepID=A0A812IZU2_SYMPI|nr:unnamed protein product [Symbiodinium pilosum]
MSRKARVDSDEKSSWDRPRYYVFNAGYGPVKPHHVVGARPENGEVVVVLHLPEGSLVQPQQEDHAICKLMLPYMQKLFMTNGQASAPRVVVILDLSPACSSMSEGICKVLDDEGAGEKLGKGLATKMARAVERLCLHGATLVAAEGAVQLALKMLSSSRILPGAIKKLVMLHPRLPASCINYTLTPKSKYSEDLQVIFDSENSQQRRLAVLEGAFRSVTSQVCTTASSAMSLALQISEDTELGHSESGESLWISEMTIELDRRSKQPRAELTDITADVQAPEPDSADEPADAESVGTGTEVAALVLRGCRCLLVRSLAGEWKGMRIPSVEANENEDLVKTAQRCIEELCDVEGSEIEQLQEIPPIPLFKGHRCVNVICFRAVNPPAGALEDADVSDDEDLYDWYTWPRALRALQGRESEVRALHAAAIVLGNASVAGIVGPEFGGVFGQEWTGTMSFLPKDGQDKAGTLPTITAAPEEVKAPALPEKKLPVSVLSGFLGAGKSTLLHHLLGNRDGMKIACIVNDMASVNVDAMQLEGAKLLHKDETMIQLSNGCICCTLREDLLTGIRSLAGENFDYALVESSGISEPLPVAETFTFEDDDGVSLGQVAHLQNMITVVDSESFLREMSSTEALRDRNWQEDESDTRGIASLLFDQVEFADIIVLNKVDLVSAEQRVKIRTLIAKINEKAEIMETCFSKLPPASIFKVARFNIVQAETNPKWLAEARHAEHVPESVEYGIHSFIFRARRPFHPQRLHCLMKAACERSGPLQALVRLKGIAWLACYHNVQMSAALAGCNFVMSLGAPWWAAMPRAEWPAGLEEDIKPLWDEAFGDRQQELVCIGLHMDEQAVKAAMQECLLTDAELDLGPETWSVWSDPWNCVDVEQGCHSHSHSHDDHGHNGHGHDGHGHAGHGYNGHVHGHDGNGCQGHDHPAEAGHGSEAGHSANHCAEDHEHGLCLAGG